MEYRQLGKSDLKISSVAFGCMSLKGPEKDDISLIEKAIASGINFFDTADLYDHGRNEELLGKAIAGKRSAVILASKVGNRWRDDGIGWDWNPRKDYILKAADESLRRLNTDYIDLYQLHGGTIDDPFDEIIEAFEILKTKGKIRYFGISSIRPEVIRKYISNSKISSVMLQYSLLDRRPEESIMKLLLENEVGMLARGPLAKGLLGGKPAEEYNGYSIAEVADTARIVDSFSGGARTNVQTALAFVLRHNAVTAAVAGIRTVEQLNEIVKAGDRPPLSDHEMLLLEQANHISYYINYR